MVALTGEFVLIAPADLSWLVRARSAADEEYCLRTPPNSLRTMSGLGWTGASIRPALRRCLALVRLGTQHRVTPAIGPFGLARRA